MTEPNNSRMAEAMADAHAKLGAFAAGPAQASADALARSFEAAAQRMSAALARAASSGEGSLKRLAKTALESLASRGLDRILGEGGAHNAEATPSSVAAPANSAIHIHFHLAGGVEDVRRHQAQIAAQLARAVAYGRRNL